MKQLTFIIVLITALFSGCKSKNDDPLPTEQQGKLYLHPSSIKIVSVQGTYNEMGRQYGTLLKADLQKWAKYYDSTWKSANPEVYNYITKIIFEAGNSLYMSPKIKDFLDGAVVTSGHYNGYLGLDRSDRR